MKLTEKEIAEIKDILASPKSITILTHRNPDGDALGSSLALKFFLEKFNHVAKVILPSEYPVNFGYLNGIEDCIVHDLNRERAMDAIKSAEVIFCLDFNSLDRIDRMGLVVEESNAKKILIDHHLDPEPFADYIFSDTSASSTCELIHRFIYDLGESDKIDIGIGEALFTGLITDTGSFKYSTNAHTYQVASDLKNRGIDDYTLQDNIFNTFTEKQLRLLGHALANRMEVIPEYSAGIIALTKKDYLDFEIQRGDTEGIVNYILMLKGIKIAAFIREQPTIVKLSLRSKGDISVQEMARKHFNGGGHKNASGGAAYAKLEDIVYRFKKILPDFVEKKVV
ncbi:MAG: bifunctional oligoribonuclease/PAP phosphatase NrnA [Saprospiraceae bacterium]|nr:bifunctional oligoribonuclease/PAP phosphatase NrnA [Bacteroidia bacterium]NNE16497.1 bifunctional oligoribonuclease/PAP phosphatase NrnA [Saprospiraceae bacterium]NNL93311.1 bifunctional oligoribonuclease/PAP phosphatase NrnA [Saprospiraceae bacterium]